MHPAPFLAYFVREELAALPNGQTSQNRGLTPLLGFIGASDSVLLSFDGSEGGILAVKTGA